MSSEEGSRRLDSRPRPETASIDGRGKFRPLKSPGKTFFDGLGPDSTLAIRGREARNQNAGGGGGGEDTIPNTASAHSRTVKSKTSMRP